ncbi:MAG: GGDEF domain-containing protein [Burkholderiales bacterium]
MPNSITFDDSSIAGTRLANVIALYRSYELKSARELCELAVSEFDPAAPDTARMALELRWWLARLARRQERLDDALCVAYAGLSASIAAQDILHECRFRGLLARTLKDLGLGEDAVAEAEIALRIAVLASDPHAEAYALEALGSIHWISNEDQQGLATFEQLERLSRQVKDQELLLMALLGQASAHDGLASQSQDAGDEQATQAHWSRSLDLHAACGVIADELHDKYMRDCSVLNRACTLQISGADEEAQVVYERLLQHGQVAAVQSQAIFFLGGLVRKAGRASDAIALLSGAVDDPLLANRPQSLQMALGELAQAYEDAGDFKAALGTMRRFHALHVANGSERAAMRARAIAIRYETDKAKAAAVQETLRADGLARLSLEDPLTGIANRRGFDVAVSRLDSPGLCTVAMLDIDHFKQVNDRFSHQVGDWVLRRAAQIMSGCCRRGDLVARFGGEEFVLLIESIDPATSYRLCERIRVAVQDEPWENFAPGLNVTISIGLAFSVIASSAGVEALVAVADQQLYAAKEKGRNCVVANFEAT